MKKKNQEALLTALNEFQDAYRVFLDDEMKMLYQSQHAELAFRNMQNLIFLKIVGRILAFYNPAVILVVVFVYQNLLTEYGLVTMLKSLPSLR